MSTWNVIPYMEQTTPAVDRTEAEDSFRVSLHEATEGFLGKLVEDDVDLEARHTVARFADVVEDLAAALADDVTAVDAGRGSPEGVVGDYPALWASFSLEGALYGHADLLNSEHVDVHLIENQSGETADGSTYSYTVLTVRPAVDVAE